jgi:hypothetical protein
VTLERTTTKEVEEEDKTNNNIMPPKSKKLPVKVATSTTPKKKKPSAVNSMDALAEGVHGLYVGCTLWSFKVNDFFFLRGPFTETEGHYGTNFCEVDIYVGMPTPHEKKLFTYLLMAITSSTRRPCVKDLVKLIVSGWR